MTRRSVFVVLLAIVLALPAMALAQTPNFSGKWIQDMEKSDQAQGGRGPAGPQTLNISQTATELTIERETPNGAMKTVYKLDGSDSVNPMGRGGDVTSKSKWDGAKLVTSYTRTMGQGSVEVTETRSLEGDTLVVVTVMKGGPQGDMTRKAVFKKG
jgi:hypothetical protein